MLCKQTSGILILILQIIVVVQLQDLVGGDYIPTKLDGFVYGNHSFNFDTNILIEAFYDPLCPYSSISWPPLKQALHHYGSQCYIPSSPPPFTEKFYGGSTQNLSKASIEKKIVKFAANVLGRSYYTSIKNGFIDKISDIQTRVSFKNAVLRGVYGTPFFYANGFLLPDREEDSINYWRGVIDPLIGAKTRHEK